MPPEIKLEILGGRELASGLQDVGKSLEKPPEEVLNIMLNAAKERTPVRTGYLRSSGYVQANIVGYGAPYAFPVHWGTRRRPARKFLTDGIAASEFAWTRAYEEDIQKQLDRVRGA